MEVLNGKVFKGFIVGKLNLTNSCCVPDFIEIPGKVFLLYSETSPLTFRGLLVLVPVCTYVRSVLVFACMCVCVCLRTQPVSWLLQE